MKNLRGKKVLREDVEVTVEIDVTEHQVQRPKDKKEQKKHYSGKKRHTIKSQIIADSNTCRIYDVDGAAGSVHDFNPYKQSVLMLCAMVLILVDSGYQSIQNYHANSKTPIKKSKNKPLSEAEKESIENINAKIKYDEQDLYAGY